MAVISVLRCTVSMTVNAAVRAGDIADKVCIPYWIGFTFSLEVPYSIPDSNSLSIGV